MNGKTIYAGGAVSLLLLFAACEMAGQNPGLFSGVEGKAAVHIRIDGADMRSRTAGPEAALEDVTKWELSGGQEREESELPVAKFSGAEDAEIFLDPGTWRFTLKGYKDNALILSGSIEGQSIILERPNNLVFTVAPVLEGEGRIKLVINLPAGSGITGALVFKDREQEDAQPDRSVTPDGDRIVVEGVYPAGDYYFSIELYKSGGLYGVVSELVEVRANLQSEREYTLTWKDLNATYVITYHKWDTKTETGYYQSTDSNKTLTADTTRQGYIFLGWYDNPALDGEPVTAIPPGSTGEKNFYARWKPGSAVQVQLEPRTDPSLSGRSLFADKQAQFSAAGEYTAWTWYWNGEPIDGAASSTYTLEAYSRDPGIYELSVVVTAGAGRKLSARCVVTIKAKGGTE